MQLPKDGVWANQADIDDPPECEMDFTVHCARGGVREVLQVGTAPEGLGSERAEVEAALSVLLSLADETGGDVEAHADGAVDEVWRSRRRPARQRVRRTA